MTENSLYLGIDCGTQGTKALLIDENGSVYGRGYAPHKLIESHLGAREQDPAWWIDALVKASKDALSSVPSFATVRALSVSGQQHGLVVLDGAREVIRNVKLWNDTETASANAEIIQRLGGTEQFRARHGIVPLTGYTVSKLLWLEQHEPENFSRIRHILLPHEYLNYWLTGEMAAEAGDASGTGYFDPRTRMWCTEVLLAIDRGSGQLSSALPRIINSDETVGVLREEVARELGLQAGCLVAAGGGDNMMGAIGTGNVREGSFTLSLGTSGTAYSYSDRPAEDPSGTLAPFCSSSGGWLPLVCTMNATNVVTATANLLGGSVSDIETALASTPPGADGLICLPFLNGERTPDLPNARGSLHGISAVNFKPNHLLRAAVEGVTFGLLSGMDLILQGRKAENIRLIGGGAKSLQWRQLIADATGTRIDVPVEPESGCLGAAIQAIVAWRAIHGARTTFETVVRNSVRMDPSATCSPRPELRQAYDDARAAYAVQLKTIHQQ